MRQSWFMVSCLALFLLTLLSCTILFWTVPHLSRKMQPETFKFLFLTFFVLEGIWQFVLSSMNARWISSRAKTVPDYLEGHVSSDELEKAAKYTAAKTRLENISSLVDGVLLIFLIVFGLFGMLDSLFTGFENDYLRAALFFSTLFVTQQVLGTPFSLYSTFVIEEKFGFNKTTPKLFCVDWIKGLALSLVLTIPILLILVWFLSSFTLWWFYSWLFLVIYSLVISLAYPRFIAPLFNKFSPLEPGSLANEMSKLMDKCGFSVKEVKVMDASRRSSHSNAYFTGFGKVKRIVLFDTLLAKLKENEIISVLAHELGHSKKRHILKSFFITQTLALAGFYLLDLIVHLDFIYAGLGLNKNSWSALLSFGLILPLSTFWLGPLFAWHSRGKEYEADAFARETVGTGEHLSTALIALSRENLSSPEPHPLFVKWHYSHPTIGERIKRMKEEEDK